MSATRLPGIELAFTSYETRLADTADYASAVMPYVLKQPNGLRVFADAIMVLTIAYLEDFLRTLVGLATRANEAKVRRHFGKHGNPEEQIAISTCDLPALVRIAKRRVSFKKRAAGIERMFDLLFGCTPWPSGDVKSLIVDLDLLRNMVVHEGGADYGIGGPGQYAAQISRQDVLTFATYGSGDTMLTTQRINPSKALVFYRDVLLALQQQSNHLRRELVTRR